MSKSAYDITQPGVSMVMDNTIFDVRSGASLSVTGSSDTLIVQDGAGAFIGCNKDGGKINASNDQI